MDSGINGVQYTIDRPDFYETQLDGGLRTELRLAGPCVRQTNNEYPETWHQDYRIGKLVLIPKQEGRGFFTFSYENRYSVSGRSAINKKVDVMQKPGGTSQGVMGALACMDDVTAKTQRVLERYSCGSLPFASYDQDTREEYRDFQDPVRLGWTPETGIEVSPDLYERVKLLATEMPLFEEVKGKIFDQVRAAGHLSTSILKGGGAEVKVDESKGFAGYDGVSASWIRLSIPEQKVAMVHTDHSLGGYSNQVRTDEIIIMSDENQVRSAVPEKDSGNNWLALYNCTFKVREPNWQQDAALVAQWGEDINARVSAVMIGLFGESMALCREEPKLFRVKSDEDDRWGGGLK